MQDIAFRAEASEELEDAATQYEEQRTGLGLQFLNAVDRSIDRLSRWPKAGVLYADVPADLAVRRVPIGGFPYHVVYMEISETVVILAVAHDRRAPAYWIRRAQD